MTGVELDFILSHPLNDCPRTLPEALVHASLSFTNRALECDANGYARNADAYEAWAGRLCDLSECVQWEGVTPHDADATLRHWHASPDCLGGYPITAAFVKEVLSTLI